MDLLFKRYASPFLIIDEMLQVGRFTEFVDEFMKLIGKEKEDEMDWQFFLHKVWEGSFGEFKAEIESNKQNQTMTKRTIETTVQNSLDILDNFNPKE